MEIDQAQEAVGHQLLPTVDPAPARLGGGGAASQPLRVPLLHHRRAPTKSLYGRQSPPRTNSAFGHSVSKQGKLSPRTVHRGSHFHYNSLADAFGRGVSEDSPPANGAATLFGGSNAVGRDTQTKTHQPLAEAGPLVLPMAVGHSEDQGGRETVVGLPPPSPPSSGRPAFTPASTQDRVPPQGRTAQRYEQGPSRELATPRNDNIGSADGASTPAPSLLPTAGEQRVYLESADASLSPPHAAEGRPRPSSLLNSALPEASGVTAFAPMMSTTAHFPASSINISPAGRGHHAGANSTAARSGPDSGAGNNRG